VSDLIFKLATRKNILIALVILLLFTVVWFPIYGMSYSSGAKNPLDLRISYNLVDIVKHFSALGEDGRADARFATGIIDMIYPLVYSGLMLLIIAFIIKRRFDSNVTLLYGMILFPLALVIIDYCENLNTLKMLDIYPNIPEALATKGALLTLLKWLITAITLSIIALGYLSLLFQKRQKNIID
jgi:hypothetical protein